MKKTMTRSFRHSLGLFVAALIVCAAASVPAPVRAADTEVFFPTSTTSGASSVNPNILFIIDTSGSMDSDDGFTDADGNPLSRLRRVQIAFRQIVNEFGNNVNIGVERFSNEQGGPILFPIQPIDSTPFGSVLSLNYTEAGGCGNEAEQNHSAGQPTRCSGAGTFKPGACPNTTATAFSLRLGTDYDKIYQQCDFRDEAEEWAYGVSRGFSGLTSTDPDKHLTDAAANAYSTTDGTATGAFSTTYGRCSIDLDLTYEKNNTVGNFFGDFIFETCKGNSLSVLNSALSNLGAGAALPGDQNVGIRFPLVDVPKSGTTVRYASLTLTDNGTNSTQTPTINVFGERVTTVESAPFVGTDNNTNNNISDVSRRTPTTTSYTWTPPAGSITVPFFSATPVSGGGYNNTAANSNLKDVLQQVIQTRTATAPTYPVTLLMKGPNSNARSGYGIYNGTANGTPVNQRPKLAIVYDGGTYNNLMTGVRFQNVMIPRGAVVTRAYVEFHNAETVDDRSLTLQINAENVGNSAAFAPPAIDNLRNRPLTSNNRQWSTFAGGTPGTSNEPWTVPYGAYRTPNLSTVVNEVAARADWCGGNSMTFLFTKVSGDAGRNAVSANVNPAYAPVLHLEIDTGQAAYASGCMNAGNSSQISASSDDAQQIINSGGMSTAGTVLSLGCTAVNGCGNKGTYVGIRFPSIKIPQGATITSAVIGFTANGGDTGTAPALIIRGQKVTNSASFNNTTSNISNRRSNSTSATVSWTPGGWTDGSAYPTPDVSTVLQELVSQPGWTTASAATFIFDGSNTNARRRAYSWDGAAGSAAKLTVTYQGANGGNTTTTVRQYLPDLVDSFSADGYTPTVGALFEAASYFRGDTAYYGRTRGGGYVNGDKSSEPPSDATLLNVSSDLAMIPGTTPHSLPAGCTTANLKSSSCRGETWTGTPIYQSPITDGCQSNNIVLLSDGFPNQGGVSDGITTGRAKAAALIGKSCLSYRNSQGVSQPEWSCGPDIAAYLNAVDQIPSTATTSHLGLTGNQTISTYTIGFGADVAGGSDSNGAEFLNRVAQAGNGRYFSAQSSDSLVQVFRSIVGSILNINTTFVAPAVTVNTFNKLTDRNELYFAVFKPGANTDWRGNLKRYQIAQPDPNNPPNVYDNSSPPVLAVDSTTGFFKDGTQSFWSVAQDGTDVAKGGAASMLTTTRNIYTYVGSSPTNVTLSGVASQNVQASNTTLNPSDSASNATIVTANQRLGLPDNAVNADRSAVLNWADGFDVNDDNGNGSTTDARTQLGDPLHSEPVLINYGLASNSPPAPAEPIPDIAIFMGTNDGGLHAFNSRDGSEYFTFIPQELLPNLNAYYADTSTYQTRPFGMDGALTSWVNDANGNGKILNSGAVETGEFAYVYAGMRRGGKNYYALDVTDRAAPKLKFEIVGGQTNTPYVELGQTWSRAIKANLRVLSTDTTARDVLIFTGGYDPAVDGEQGVGVQADTQGRALYVADASTGALLWWAGFDNTAPSNTVHPNLVVPQMIYSVPASPAVMDLDGDREVDRIYIADAGGQIFRFILGANSNGKRSLKTNASTNNTSVQYLAQLSGTTTTSAHRFYGAPAVARIADNTNTPFISVAIGSGYREHPLATENEDRFYVIRDPDITNEVNANRTVKDIVNATSTAYVQQSTEGTATADLYDATANYIGTSCAAGDTVCNTNKAKAVSAFGTSTTNGTSKGYYIRLVDSSGTLLGEKVLDSATIVNSTVIFSTFQPGSTAAAAACSAVKGQSRVYYINVVDGTPTQERDGVTGITAGDRAVIINIGGLPPSPVVITPSINTYTGTDGQQRVCTGSNCITGDNLVCVGAVCQKMSANHWGKYSWRKLEN